MSSLVRQTFAKRLFDKDDIGCAPDVLSYYLPANLSYFQVHSKLPGSAAAKTYYYWQSHMEKPDVHRVLAGLYLWKSKAHGIAPYCYQHLPQPPFSPFDDFDEWEPGSRAGRTKHPFKDHMTTYPARSGSIRTIQWKGMADGIYDLRYLITFESAIRELENCRSAEDRLFINEARSRFDRFLRRISLTAININSDTEATPYQDIKAEEYASFREQLARDIIVLAGLKKTHAGAE
jgi:hypothetical protein